MDNVDKLILPGVGAFNYAIEKLDRSGMLDAVERLVHQEKKDILGICVGMQMLARSSEEGENLGLGWIDAEVLRFDESFDGAIHSIPHMGWNNIQLVKNDGLLQGLDSSSFFYFLHSYYFHTRNSEHVLATTYYGKDFICAVNRENIYGVQFHPEKSHLNGIKVLKNFAEL